MARPCPFGAHGHKGCGLSSRLFVIEVVGQSCIVQCCLGHCSFVYSASQNKQHDMVVNERWDSNLTGIHFLNL